jgi:hypothetical protein
MGHMPQDLHPIENILRKKPGDFQWDVIPGLGHVSHMKVKSKF